VIIRSYYRDFGWLRQSLASVRRWGTGFRRTVLVLPQSSLDRWRLLAAELPGLPDVELVGCPDYPDDYLGQQITKLYADELTDADYLWHIDADCIVRRPVTPGDLLSQGRPIQLMEPYAALSRHLPWRELTEDFLGLATPYEFMRQPPYVFPRWLYPELRTFCLARHGRSLADYVRTRSPRGFAEFNALSGYAWHFHREAFSWQDLSVEPLTDPVCRVFWSRGGLDPASQAEIALLLA
jgi:Family of unknown function (DUF6492)